MGAPDDEVGATKLHPGRWVHSCHVVEAVEIDQLTDADALPDGFATADALREELNMIYGEKIAAGSQAFRVAFKKLDENN